MFQFIFAGFLATLLAYLSYKNKKDSYLVFALVIMWYIAAFQDCIASDFNAYKEWFDKIRQGRMGFSLIRTDRDNVEVGWYILNKTIGYFSSSFYAVSAIVYLFVFSVFYRLLKQCPSKWRWMAVFYLYFTHGWFTSIMSAERQTLAIAFWILLFFSLREKKYIKSMILAVLGYSFHNSFLYSIPFLLLMLIPFDRINFVKFRWGWLLTLIAIFLAVILSIQSIQVELSLLFADLNEDVTNSTDIYNRYVEEITNADLAQKTTTIISRLISFIFVVLALLSNNKRNTEYNLFFVYLLLSLILMGAFGSFGSFARIFRYPLFLSLPAISYTAQNLNKEMRLLFILYTVFITMYSLISAFHTEQFVNYLDYHTIFF